MRKTLIVVTSVLLLVGILACNRNNTQPTMAASSVSPVRWFRPDGTVNWEAKKEQRHIGIDTIVIHHTGTAAPISLQQLSEDGRQRPYLPRYESGSNDPYVKGKTPASGHFGLINGRKVEVFYFYHWIVRADGRTERLLSDNMVAWGNSNWDISNCSVAICLDGNFENTDPPGAMLKATVKLIAGYAKKYPIRYLVGHYDVKRTGATACPGNWYYTGGRETLITMASKIAGRKLAIAVKHPLAVR